jgi:tyrosine-protein phosphatase non-receptor type 4
LQVGSSNKDFLSYLCDLFSAGIGRTGVLILMETALCLMETNQAILPLNTVQQMREQRIGMIQTAV